MDNPAPTASALPAATPWRVPRASSARMRLLIAGVAGAALAAGFAPVNLWPLGMLAPAVLMWLWQDATPREAARLGFAFSTTTFIAGTYWLYFSVHILGQAPIWLAFVLMLGLAGIMGLYHAALGYGVARWLPEAGVVRWLIALPAAWLLVEWWRGWFLSGFSWLSLGYSQTDTWLASFAPIAGVYGISAMLLLSAGALTAVICGTKRVRIAGVVVFLAPWIAGATLRSVEWTHPTGPPV